MIWRSLLLLVEFPSSVTEGRVSNPVNTANFSNVPIVLGKYEIKGKATNWGDASEINHTYKWQTKQPRYWRKERGQDGENDWQGWNMQVQLFHHVGWIQINKRSGNHLHNGHPKPHDPTLPWFVKRDFRKAPLNGLLSLFCNDDHQLFFQ